MSILTNCKHIVNPKLKHIYLSFDEYGYLVVKSPKVSSAEIEKILIKKSAWIQRARDKIQSKKGKMLDFSQTSELYFLGKPYPIFLIYNDRKCTRFIFDGDNFKLYYNKYDEAIFRKHIDAFYRKEAIVYVLPLLQKWSNIMKLPYKKVSFRKTKRQWGSCSSENTISLNIMMMKLPHDIIQYIVIHELAHIKHKHHQKAFWELVSKHLPMYKEFAQKLKDYST